MDPRINEKEIELIGISKDKPNSSNELSDVYYSFENKIYSLKKGEILSLDSYKYKEELSSSFVIENILFAVTYASSVLNISNESLSKSLSSYKKMRITDEMFYIKRMIK